MQSDDISSLLEGCLVVTPQGRCEAARLPWNAHPAFAGVSLKQLVSGEATDGALSCHLVRVEPQKALRTHVHEGQWELHEVVAGSGTAEINGERVDYRPGVVAVIARGQPHAVTAGPDGLRLLAKFFPALV